MKNKSNKLANLFFNALKEEDNTIEGQKRREETGKAVKVFIKKSIERAKEKQEVVKKIIELAVNKK